MTAPAVHSDADDLRADAWQTMAADYDAGHAVGFAARRAGAEPDLSGAPDRDPWKTCWQRGCVDGFIAAGYATAGERDGREGAQDGRGGHGGARKNRDVYAVFW